MSRRTWSARVADRLPDARGREVVLVSHCLLNENARYLGGAFHRGAVPEMADALRSGVGIHQLPCPERVAWGGVRKPLMLAVYGLDARHLGRLRGPLLAVFTRWTRLRYRLLARRVARDVADYEAAGISVRAYVGVGASPSCGVATTLDLRAACAAAARCPLAELSTARVNRDVVRAARTSGRGLFVEALTGDLERRGVQVAMREYDLLAEMDGRPQPGVIAAPPAA